jgi:putative copper export protein
VTVRLRSPWAYFALLFAAIPVALIVLASIGGLTETQLVGIPVVPVYTLFGLPIDLIIRDIAMACTLGCALVGGVLNDRPHATLGKLTSVFALVWLATLLVQSILTVSEVLALSAGDSINLVILQSLLTQTTVGQVIVAQFILVSLVALLGWVVLGKVTGWIVVGLAATAVFLPGLTGHSGLSDGHNAASIALGFHLVFMAVWIGGLVALVWYVSASDNVSRVVINRYSLLAAVSVVVVVESGLLNASMRIDGIAPYLTSTYGAIIIAKVTIVVVLVGFGWQHRRELAQTQGDKIPQRLLQLASGELLWMGVVIGLAVALSRTAPPAFAIAAEPISFGALALLILALPLALVHYFPALVAGAHKQLLAKYPEAISILMVVLMFVVAELMSSGTLANAIGIQIAGLVFILSLPLAGVFFMASQYRTPSAPALVIFFVGWCAVVYWQLLQRELPLDIGTVFVTLGVLGLLLFVWRPRSVDRQNHQVEPEHVEVNQ